MGSSAKTGKFLIGGSQEQKRCTFLGPKYKSAIWDRTAPHLHIKSSLYVCRRVQGSQIFKQNWIISICWRLIVIFLICVFSALGGGTGRWRYLGGPAIVYMSSGVFRGKESSDRIELSWLVQDLLNFGVALGGGVGGGVCGGGFGGLLPHMHMHVHACIHMHAHVYMYRNCKWPPLWRHPCLSCLTCICMRAYMHVHACMCVHVHVCMGHPPTHPHPPHANPPTPTPQGNPQNQ